MLKPTKVEMPMPTCEVPRSVCIRCSHGGNLHLLHAVNRPLRGASVNLVCFFLRPGAHGCKLTPLPGLCQPWLLFFGGRSGGRIRPQYHLQGDRERTCVVFCPVVLANQKTSAFPPGWVLRQGGGTQRQSNLLSCCG